MSILITGASGTIGTQLLLALKEKGLEAAVMTSRPGNSLPGYKTVQGDFGNLESLQAAFQGFDTIFLLQPLTPQMVEYGLNAVAAAKAAGVRHIVRSSGAGADSSSDFSIAKAHGTVDDAVRASGVAWTLVRPMSFMQNFLSFYAGQVVSGAFYAPHGDGATSLVDVRDIAESAAAILANPAAHAGKTYDLTGGEALTDAQQMAIISAGIGRTVQYVDIPEEAAASAIAGMGIPAVVVDWLMSLNAVIKAGYAAGVSGDVQRLTGHAPRSFADFVKDYAATWTGVAV
jgi:uncharacterized protein YbjT (DUF2867 family)